MDEPIKRYHHIILASKYLSDKDKAILSELRDLQRANHKIVDNRIMDSIKDIVGLMRLYDDGL